MDPYQRLLIETKLYNTEVVENFLSDTPNWNILNYREKEIRALHLTCCVYLCNLEKITDVETILKMGTHKRSLEAKMENSPKRRKVELGPSPDEPMPSTSEVRSTPSSSSSNSQRSTNTTIKVKIDTADKEGEERLGQQFRFSLIGYMPNPAVVQSNLCHEWNIPNSTRRWDIVDHKERKFICLEISENLDEAESRYLKRAVDVRENSAMVVVGPISLSITYTNLTEKPVRESKVRTFLTERRANMKILGLMETELSFSSNLDVAILCSPYINGWCTEWISDCSKGENDTHGDNVLYSGKKSSAANLHPHNFISNLSTLNEESRVDYVKWRGKTLPESFVSNIVTEESKDAGMITLVTNKIKACLNDRSEIIHLGYSEGNSFEGILEEF